ncbi:hypothetical protein P280DRAFT_449238 [Massarina eburnea CBS 473.64]|uniref:Uncharacterized protein n=1 Tax=Massarina eburnea CBS 473.64 TaxID=1395130 RepID=A0A6A6S225_9PLEO|nr:hypothetical protein P280DRAFT_449238 [Massarina eburnea CBS 473.64]
MDFSNNVFQTRSSPTISSDTMSHAKLVQACRFGWAAGTDDGTSASTPAPAPSLVCPPLTASLEDTRARRLTPCRGRLYHQLTCSHRIRTDLVEDCGPNCLEPHGLISQIPFYCNECVENECANIWNAREANHNALYPSMGQMTREQYNMWYDERRQLEKELAKDRTTYELQLRANTRSTNVSSALEMSKEQADFANELDSLSLSLMTSNEDTGNYEQAQHRHRISLPNDASEQLHWGLNSLALDRGSCGVEYSGTQSVQPLRTMTKEEIWKQARGSK